LVLLIRFAILRLQMVAQCIGLSLAVTYGLEASGVNTINFSFGSLYFGQERRVGILCRKIPAGRTP
jgi:hypothetical protein